MGRVVFRAGDDWDAVELEAIGGSSALGTELAQVVTSYGGERRETSLVLSRLNFRRSAREIAIVLQRYGAEPEYSPVILALLTAHVEELNAREASKTSDKITREDLRKKLATSRFQRVLTESQVRNLRRLLALRHGAHFSVPGAGKKATRLATYEALRYSGAVDRLLVVLPKNAMLAWEDEIAECFPADPPIVRRLRGGYDGVVQALRDDPEVCLITYQLLPNVYSIVSEWCYRHKAHVVLDEAHRVKAGMSGVLAAAAIKLSGTSIRRDILTGTPLPQSPEDLRPQLEFLWPAQRILSDERLESSTSSEAMERTQQTLSPLYVRTTKKDLGLRPPDIIRVSVQLGPLQAELYELLRSEAKRVATGMSARDRAFLRSLGRHVVRLLEAATNPILLTRGTLIDETNNAAEHLRAFELLRVFAQREKPAKLTKAVEIATEILSHNAEQKVILWTSFVHNILSLERVLAAWNPLLLYGAVETGEEQDPDTREGRIRQFHSDPRCRVMIANPAACGEGISLHQACHHAIYVDRTFNAAHYLQSVDRIHRLGLRPSQITEIYVLEAVGTVDLRVAARLHKKIEAMSRILNDTELAALAYDPEDVVEEFPAGIEPGDIDEIVEHLVERHNDRRR